MRRNDWLGHVRWLPALLLLWGFTAWAADGAKRSPPPEFKEDDVSDASFVADPRTLLTGSTPVAGSGTAAVATSNGGGSTTTTNAAPSDGNSWSALISGETLESEVKSQPTEIDKALKGTHQQKDARMAMTYIATLYGVIMHYDKDVRWKEDAQALRDSFARAGHNMKAWTDTQQKQAVKLQTDLKDLIGGNKPSLTTQFDAAAGWSEIADRPPLMHRLDLTMQERLPAWTKDPDAVKKNADAIIREAEVVAMISRVIQDKSYDSTDDDTYMGFAKALEQCSMEVVAATKQGDGAAAGSAVARMQKACTDCHEQFR